MKAGFDFGSKNISIAIIDKERVVFTDSLAHNGNMAQTLEKVLDRIHTHVDIKRIDTFGLTGNLNTSTAMVYDPVIASVEANKFLNTGCKNIFSIGCENFYLIRLDGAFNYLDHTVNSDCASGTGGFIDQQAERLGFSTPELGEKAHAYTEKPPAIATRCAVFAKSDIIHAQAKGFSKEAICAGLCEGVARNVLANTVQGRQLDGDILFTGGMSLNQKIVDELSSGLKKQVIVPDETLAFNAIGAAMLGKATFQSVHTILNDTQTTIKTRNPLKINLSDYPDFNADKNWVEDGVEITMYEPLDQAAYSVYFGIDVGSTSTKAIAMTTDERILAGLYARTKGDPVKAVSLLLLKLKQLFAKTQLTIRGVGTTGSGRQLIYQVIQADEAINEITAHALGATFIDPDVDTIIEIGGQDSKFTQLSDGRVTNAVMNYVCAAGTGSFIEEQAKRLSISLDDISGMADNQKAPFTSDRCTVYMERDLNIFLSEGWKKQQIITAVLYSVRDNYLSKVVGKSRVGNHVYFQGATARNKALVAVFENELQKEISVSKYCHLTGALGCAVSLRDKNLEQTQFKSMSFSYDTHTEICDLCPNQCELRVYTTGNNQTAWGLKCGRDYDDKQVKGQTKRSKIEIDFKRSFAPSVPAPEMSDLVVGLPETLFMKEYSGMFTDFFHRLGIKTIIEKSSSKKLNKGMEMINADFCAPMALSHGMIESLAKKQIDFIFFPTMINEQNLAEKLPREALFSEKMTDAYFCYYSSYAPDIIDNLPSFEFKMPIVSPKIKLNNIDDIQVAKNLALQLESVLKRPSLEIENAFVLARQSFYDARKNFRSIGKDLIEASKDRLKIMLLGRPYALFDERMNLGIPYKLENKGFDLISQTMLGLNNDALKPDHIENMHWYFGQQILLASQLAADTPDIYPIFLTCFRCSPDAYLITYFKQIMEKANKPYLILQLDEHSSDVGYMTRIEAAIDSFINDFKQLSDKKHIPFFVPESNMQIEPTRIKPNIIQPDDTILIPATDDRINLFQKQVFETAGYKANILALDTAIMNMGYRFASGGECLPNVAITGSVIHALKTREIDPEKSILYLPNICLSCNFNQYANLVRVACKNAGFPNIRVMDFNGLTAVPELNSKTNAHLLSVTILGSILEKLKRRFQPYETKKGTIQALIQTCEQNILDHIRDKKSLLNAAKQIRILFEAIDLPDARKPIIAILGDMYAKFNAVLNDDVCDQIESLGGEVLLPSYNELVLHAMHADIIENAQDARLLSTMTRYEHRFGQIFDGLLNDRFEPSLDECNDLIQSFGLKNFIAGETAISVGRLLYYIKHQLVDAVVHVNPILCCPGVISASIFKNIQDKYDIPIIDLFYDGTNKPNKMIEPLMFYLSKY